MQSLEKLQFWYSSNCNGDWEHTYGININTLDNPGWKITIDLSETIFESLSLEKKYIDLSKNDWYIYYIKDNQFIGSGDASKLEFLINVFLKLVELDSQNNR